MTEESVVRNRLRLLPPIRRSRLWRLYAEDGRRFLDFWMDGGRSLLGAKGTGIGTIAKAAVDTGLTRPFPSVREARLERELLARHPGFAAVRLFLDEGRAVAAASRLLAAGESLRVIMPFESFYRTPVPAAGGLAMPLLCCPAVLSPAALLFEDAKAAEAVPGDLVPPLALACAHRALCELERFAVDYKESLWRRVDRRLGPFFARSGPYLYTRSGAEAYERLFAAALSAGALLSPDPELPSIIPGDFDDGELAKLAAALAVALENA